MGTIRWLGSRRVDGWPTPITASGTWGEGALKQLLRAALKPVAAATDLIKRPAAGVTVLIYHRVGAASSSQVDLDPGLFEEQMAELAHSGRLMALDDAIEVLQSETVPEVDPVVVTFDDGTPDFVDVALPILEQHRVPATLYLATNFIEEGLPFWAPDDAPLTWTAVTEAVSTGLIDIGSHTHTHALLDRLSPDAISEELERSIDLICERLDIEARHFAYPKALAPSAAADAAVRAHFDSAAVAGTRSNPYSGTDVHLLARTPIQQSDGMRWFRHKANGGMGLEDRLRERINKRRYASATS